MLLCDADGNSFYVNAPNEEFKDWLNSLKSVETLIDGSTFATTALSQSDHLYKQV